MDINHTLAKTYLRSLATKDDLIKLLDKLNLTDLERNVLTMYYLDHKDLGYIADTLNYSIQYIKIIHHNALMKVSSYIHMFSS